MAKKKSKIVPLYPIINPSEMTRKDLLSLGNQRINPKYDYTDTHIETDFGVLKMRECDFNETIYGDSMPLIFDYDKIADAGKADNLIELAPLLEQAITKYPKGMIFYLQLVNAYKRLKQYDKADAIIIQNYNVNKGLPVVDIMFMQLGNEKDTAEYRYFYDKKLYSIHDAYPEQAHFHPFEILEFYKHLGECAINCKDVLVAESCLKVLQKVDAEAPETDFLKISIDKQKHPYKFKFKLLGLIAVCLGIVGLIIWGIYRLFTWIF